MSPKATAPRPTLRGRDLLRTTDLDAAELEAILDLAARTKADRALLSGALSGRVMALLFEKPSLRTKSSFAAAAARLGMVTVSFGTEEIGLGSRESVSDGARVLGRYFDLLVHRTFGQARLDELATHCPVPVVNGLTDHEHPCQALADLMTLRERFGRLEGLRLAWIGDGNNVCHSLMLACALAGVGMAVATPEGHAPDPAVVTEALRLGGDLDLGLEPAAAAEGAHAVVTDTWISMGREEEAAARALAFAPFRVDASLMARARPDAVFLHCLPAHRGQEVTEDVFEGPSSAVFDEAENRMHVQLALMALLLGAG